MVLAAAIAPTPTTVAFLVTSIYASLRSHKLDCSFKFNLTVGDIISHALSFISTQFFVLILDGWFRVLANRCIIWPLSYGGCPLSVPYPLSAHMCNISRKLLGMKLIFFCMQINMKVFCKLIVSLWICASKHAQSTQSNLKDEVDFLLAAKY